MKLRSKVLLLVTGALIFSGSVITGVTAITVSRDVVAQKTADFGEFSNGIAAKLDTMIKGHLAAGEIYARLPVVQSMNYPEIEPWLVKELAARKLEDPQFANMLIAD